MKSKEEATPGAETFIPSEALRSKTCSVICEAGKEQEFCDKAITVDIAYLNQNKIYDILYHDLIIELIGLKDDQETDCVLATMCRFIPETKNEKTVYKVKADQQKIKVKGFWFEMNDVYGFSADVNR